MSVRGERKADETRRERRMTGDTETDGQTLKEVTHREKYDGKPSHGRKILDLTHG